MRRSVTAVLCAIGVIFIVISLPFLGIAYVFYSLSANSLHGTIQTSGTIVTMCGGNSGTCQPIVSFRTKSGQTIQFTSSFSSSSMHAGDSVPVNYHPNDPQDAVMSSFLSLWLFPILLGSIGGFLLLMAIAFFISALVVVFSKRFQAPLTPTAPTVPTVPTFPSAPMVPTFPSILAAPTLPSDSMALTLPSDSMAPTFLSNPAPPAPPLDSVSPSDPAFPYHDPMNNNPYR